VIRLLAHRDSLKRAAWALVPVVACLLPALLRGQVAGESKIVGEEKPATPASSAAPSGRQVTAFAILAVPDSSELDPRLDAVEKQLHKVLPGFGFRVLDVKTKWIETGGSIACDLGNGYKAETLLLKPLDENGKVQLRCSLNLKGKKEFSTLVRSPLNQLFFYERTLKPGTRVLIGVGAR